MELNKEIENKTQEKNGEDENEKEEIKTLDINLNKDKNYEKIRINLCPNSNDYVCPDGKCVENEFIVCK